MDDEKIPVPESNNEEQNIDFSANDGTSKEKVIEKKAMVSEVDETDELEETITIPLEELLYDSDEVFEARETPEEKAQYKSSIAEYKATIAKTLKAAKELNNDAASIFIAKAKADEEIDEDEAAVLSTLKSIPEKEEKQAEEPVNASDNAWHSEITLIPEEYKDNTEAELHGLYENGEVSAASEDASDKDEPSEYEDDDSDDAVQLQILFEEETPEKNIEKEEKFVYNPDKPRAIDSIFDFVELFIFTLVAVMLLTTFFFRHSVVQGDSMLNTLEEGDHLIISDVFYTPERGDIVVFEDYSTVLDKAVVKRVIGLPGETVEVKINADEIYEVYINGELLDESYAYNEPDYSSYVGKWEVGEGEIFVMGDNRYNSTDSRDPRVGPISIDSILGKVILRFYPFDKFGTVE